MTQVTGEEIHFGSIFFLQEAGHVSFSCLLSSSPLLGGGHPIRGGVASGGSPLTPLPLPVLCQPQSPLNITRPIWQ